MDKQELVNKMVTKGNFHKYVEVCLSEGLKIEKIQYAPDILVYHDYIQDEFNVSYAGNWTYLSLINLRFKVNDEWLSGVENFFKNYQNITKIEQKVGQTGGLVKKSWVVIPNMIGGNQWTRDRDFSAEGHYEISFNAHS